MEQKQLLNISEIKSHFEKLSEEYGFSVNPKAGVLFVMAMDLKNEKKLTEQSKCLNISLVYILILNFTSITWVRHINKKERSNQQKKIIIMLSK